MCFGYQKIGLLLMRMVIDGMKVKFVRRMIIIVRGVMIFIVLNIGNLQVRMKLVKVMMLVEVFVRMVFFVFLRVLFVVLLWLQFLVRYFLNLWRQQVEQLILRLRVVVMVSICVQLLIFSMLFFVRRQRILRVVSVVVVMLVKGSRVVRKVIFIRMRRIMNVFVMLNLVVLLLFFFLYLIVLQVWIGVFVIYILIEGESFLNFFRVIFLVFIEFLYWNLFCFLRLLIFLRVLGMKIISIVLLLLFLSMLMQSLVLVCLFF